MSKEVAAIVQENERLKKKVIEQRQQLRQLQQRYNERGVEYKEMFERWGIVRDQRDELMMECNRTHNRLTRE